ncbi:TaqI-like C-terminal specificity domain-containing protein, partial [Helicobacter sp. faydin-H75]
YEWAGKWILFIPWHFPNTQNPKSMEENEKDLSNFYPSLYMHLLEHKDKLSNRNKDETGIRYEWYCLQRWGSNYMSEFNRQKIVYSEIVQSPQFYLDKNNFYAEATSFILTGNFLEYLIGMLHSKLLAFAFKNFYAGGGLGEKGYRYKKAFLELLPIPKITESKQQEFVKIVNEILESKAKNQDAKALQEVLDKMVYTLYNLNDKEIELIESSFN